MFRSRLLLLVLMPVVLVTAVPAQRKADPDAPKSLAELTARVDTERRLPASKRRKSIRYFTRFRTGAARNYLLAMAATEDNTTILSAVLGQLRYHNHPSVLKSLAGTLQDKRYQQNTRVLKAAAYSMAAQPGGIRLLLQELKKPHSEVRLEAAVYGLRLVKDPNVLPLLRRVFVQERYQDNASLLRGIAWALARRGKHGVELLLAELKKPRSKNHRTAALHGLRYAPDKDAVFGALKVALDRAEPKQKLRILQALGTHTDNLQLTRLLLGLLLSKNPQLRTEALYQLAMASHPRTRQAALQLAQEIDTLEKLPMERAKVAYVLMRVMQAEDITAILKLAAGANRYLAARIKSLRTDKNKMLYPRFVKHLGAAAAGDGPEPRRYTAMRLLVACPGKESNRALLACMGGGSGRITATALRTLVSRKDKRVVSHLERLLAADNVDLKLEAMLGLHQFRKGSSAWPRRLMQLLTAAQTVIRFVAIELLGELEHRPALPLVQPLLGHEKWQVRSLAYGFCRKVRDISSVPLLIGRLGHENGRLRHECNLALRDLTHMTYREPEHWQQWWQSSKETFQLPPAAIANGSTTGRPVAATMTYYSIPLFSNRVCFVVDTSGSMAQKVGTARITKLEAAKQALRVVIDKCKPEFRFNIIHFATRASTWTERLNAANDENKISSRKFVEKLRATGGTNVHDAMKMAFEDMEVDTIYLLSDGYPSAGPITNIQRLADEICSWNIDRRIVIHTIAIGADSVLLKRLAAESGGIYVRRL